MPRTLDALQAGQVFSWRWKNSNSCCGERRFSCFYVSNIAGNIYRETHIHHLHYSSFCHFNIILKLSSIMLTSFSIVFITGPQNIITLGSFAPRKASALQEAFGARQIKVPSQLANMLAMFWAWNHQPGKRKWVGENNWYNIDQKREHTSIIRLALIIAWFILDFYPLVI